MSIYSKLLVAALNDEIKEIKEQLQIDRVLHLKPATLYQGHWGETPISIFVSGLGAERMSTGLQKLSEFYQPTQVCHIGYAGGTSPVMGIGKILIADIVKDQQTANEWIVPVREVERAKHFCQNRKLAFETGGILTVPEAVSDPMQKAFYGAKDSVLALDMESSCVVKWATEKNIPFCVIRSIFDPLDMRLPDFGHSFKGAQPETGEVVEHMIKNPKDALKIPQLQYCATTARRSLTDFAKIWSQSL